MQTTFKTQRAAKEALWAEGFKACRWESASGDMRQVVAIVFQKEGVFRSVERQGKQWVIKERAG